MNDAEIRLKAVQTVHQILAALGVDVIGVPIASEKMRDVVEKALFEVRDAERGLQSGHGGSAYSNL